jgi:hypothetical protein
MPEFGGAGHRRSRKSLIRRGRDLETALVRVLIMLSVKKSAGVGVSGIVVRGESADSPLVFVPDGAPKSTKPLPNAS